MDALRIGSEVQQMTRDILYCCECGIPYQTRPLPFIYNFDSRVLVVAQNPGMADDDEIELWQSVDYSNTKMNLDLYRYLFKKCRAYREFGRLYFGPNWIDKGSQFSYTNAVHCRTENNHAPSLNMQVACKPYLLKFINALDFNYIILAGSIARAAVNDSMDWNRIYKTSRGRSILCVRHYQAFQSSDDVAEAARLVKEMIEDAYKE